MKLSRKQSGLIILLISVLALSAYFYIEDQNIETEIVGQSEVKIKENINALQSKSFKKTFEGRFIDDSTKDLFKIKTPIVDAEKNVPVNTVPPVTISAPPQVVSVAQEAPPPFPFTYIGKYSEGGRLVVFLGYNGQNLIVKTGDIIQQKYKVEEISPSILTMTYIPMDIKQTIQIGAK